MCASSWEELGTKRGRCARQLGRGGECFKKRDEGLTMGARDSMAVTKPALLQMAVRLRSQGEIFASRVLRASR